MFQNHNLVLSPFASSDLRGGRKFTAVFCLLCCLVKALGSCTAMPFTDAVTNLHHEVCHEQKEGYPRVLISKHVLRGFFSKGFVEVYYTQLCTSMSSDTKRLYHKSLLQKTIFCLDTYLCRIEGCCIFLHYLLLCYLNFVFMHMHSF